MKTFLMMFVGLLLAFPAAATDPIIVYSATSYSGHVGLNSVSTFTPGNVWEGRSQSVYIGEDNGDFPHVHDSFQSLRNMALSGVPILWLWQHDGASTIHALDGERSNANTYLTLHGRTDIAITNAEPWMHNPLYTDGERKLFHLLQNASGIDSVRRVAAEKVIWTPTAAPPAYTDPETGEEVQPDAPASTELTIRFWPPWVIYNDGSECDVTHIVIDTSVGRAVVWGNNSAVAERATISIKQGSYGGSGSPVSWRISDSGFRNLSGGALTFVEYSY